MLFEVFDLARKQKYIEENFISDIDFNYKQSGKCIHDAFTESEVAALWEQSNDKKVQIVLIMIYTGLRIEELLSLKTENIHLGEHYMIGGVKTDAGENRIIPISEKVFPFIASRMSDNAYLLHIGGKRYQRQKFMNEIWNPVMSQINASHLPHDTRYTCASMLDRAKANPNTIKDILGHSKGDVTSKVYIKKNLDDLRTAIDLI
jgi:integrase